MIAVNTIQRVAVLLVAAAAVVGCQPPAPPASSPSVERPSEPAPVDVRVARVRTRQLTTELTLPASIEPDAQAPLMSTIQAYVASVHVDIGDAVEKGQLLIELDAPELAEQVNRRAKVVEQDQAEVRLAEAELEAARSRLNARRAKVALRESEKTRIGELTDRGVLAEQRRDEAEFDEESARADLVSAESELAVAAAKVERARARVGVAEAELAEAVAMAGYRKIVAPFDGVVTQRGVDPGVFVEPAMRTGSKPLVTVADVRRLRAVVHLTIDDAPHAKVGAEAELTLNNAPGRVVTGKLARVSGVFDTQTRMMRAEIDVDNPTGAKQPQLRAGGYGVARIVARQERLPSAPATSVLRTAGGVFVVKVDTGGALAKAPVEVGIESGGFVGFASGVAEGDRVLVDDAERLQNEPRVTGRLVEIAR